MLSSSEKHPVRARAIRGFTANPNHHFSISCGEKLLVARENLGPPDWRWTIKPDGSKAGWVPAEYLDVHGVLATANTFFEYSELTLTRGQRLVVERSAGSWLLVRDARGACGWIPSDNIWVLLPEDDDPLFQHIFDVQDGAAG